MHDASGIAPLKSIQPGGGQAQWGQHDIKGGQQPATDQRQRATEFRCSAVAAAPEFSVSGGFEGIFPELDQRAVHIEKDAAAGQAVATGRY